MNGKERNAMFAVLASLAVACKDQGQLEPQRVTSIGAGAVPGAVMTESTPDDDEPVIDIGDADDPNRKTEVRRLGDYSQQEQARIRQILSSDKLKERMALVRSIAERGTLALVLVDTPLGGGAIGQVHLNASPPLSRFVVASPESLDDELIDRAASLAFKYEARYPMDRDQVMFTLFADGRYTRVSRTNGRVEEQQVFKGFYADRMRRTVEYLQLAAQIKPTNIKGVGRGRVVSLGK